MLRRWFSVAMVLMIALQSVAAIADAHQLHQSGTQHLTFDHSHLSSDIDNGNQLVKHSPDQPGQPLYDCHHCCHCHGHASVVPAGSLSHFAIFSGTELADYQAHLTSKIPTSLFRPPIV